MLTFLDVVHMFDLACQAAGAPAMVSFLVFAHMFHSTEHVVLGGC